MAAHQAPLSLGFSRQEHWSGLPFPSPEPYWPLKSNALGVTPGLGGPMWGLGPLFLGEGLYSCTCLPICGLQPGDKGLDYTVSPPFLTIL